MFSFMKKAVIAASFAGMMATGIAQAYPANTYQDAQRLEDALDRLYRAQDSWGGGFNAETELRYAEQDVRLVQQDLSYDYYLYSTVLNPLNSALSVLQDRYSAPYVRAQRAAPYVSQAATALRYVGNGSQPGGSYQAALDSLYLARASADRYDFRGVSLYVSRARASLSRTRAPYQALTALDDAQRVAEDSFLSYEQKRYLIANDIDTATRALQYDPRTPF